MSISSRWWLRHPYEEIFCKFGCNWIISCQPSHLRFIGTSINSCNTKASWWNCAMEARSTTIKVNPLHPGKSGLMDTQNHGIWKRYLLCFIHGYIEMSIRQNSGGKPLKVFYSASSNFKNGALVDVSYSTIFLRAWSLECPVKTSRETNMFGSWIHAHFSRCHHVIIPESQNCRSQAIVIFGAWGISCR